MASFGVELSVTENGRRKPEYTLDSDLNGQITLQELLQWTKATLLVTADEVLKEEQAKGFDEEPVLVVDGRRNKPIQSVSPLGQIEFVARSNFGDILIEAYEALIHRSKVLTGQYRDSHYVFHNGKQVAEGNISLNAWLKTNPVFNDKDTIRIVNIQPYARRLELLGVTEQRTQNRRRDLGSRDKKKAGLKAKMPNGAYQLTTRAIRAKYKQNSGIRFAFLPGTELGLSGSFKGKKGTSTRTRKGSLGRSYLYPSIVFTVSSRGII